MDSNEIQPPRWVGFYTAHNEQSASAGRSHLILLKKKIRLADKAHQVCEDHEDLYRNICVRCSFVSL